MEKNKNLIEDILNIAKKSINFQEVEYSEGFDSDDWDSDVIYIKSKLKGFNEHKDEFDEYEIGIDNGKVILHYLPSGYTKKLNSVNDFINITRAFITMPKTDDNVEDNDNKSNSYNNISKTFDQDFAYESNMITSIKEFKQYLNKQKINENKK